MNMSKREPSPAQARYYMRFRMHAVPDTAPRQKTSFLSRAILAKAFAFVAVLSMAFSSFIPITNAKQPQAYATTNSDCTPSMLQFYAGDSVYFGGHNFTPFATVGVTIKGFFGSPDLDKMVGQVSTTVNANGDWCVKGYEVQPYPDDMGDYKGYVTQGLGEIGILTQFQVLPKYVPDNPGNGHTPVAVCHQEGNGSYHKIVIDDDGLHGHEHHDGDIIIYDDSEVQECPADEVDEPVETIICHQTGEGFEQMTFDSLEEANEHIAGHAGDFLLPSNGLCGQVEGDDTVSREVEIQKVWTGYPGKNNGPENKSDIAITIEDGDDDIICEYDESGNLECDETVRIDFPGGTLNIDEDGIPAGWSTMSGTGQGVVPNCPEDEEAPCTVVITNSRNVAGPCGTELVTNGGFELPDVSADAGWQLFESGTDDLGWSSTGNIELHEGVLVGAHGGNQSAETDSDGTTSIFQDLSTHAGSQYTVTLWTMPRPDTGGTTSTSVTVDGSVIGTINEDNSTVTDWTEHTFTFTATGSISTLAINDLGGSNGLGALIDDISVVEDCNPDVTTSDVTICKENAAGAPLSDWQVFLKGDLVDTVTVSGESNTPVSSDVLPAGDYVFEANGTYVYRAGSDGDLSDAAYSERVAGDASIDPSFYSGSFLPWVRNLDLGAGYAGYLGIRVNNTNFNWGSAYNSSHEYSALYNAALDGAATFYIEDGNAYSDNSGSLTVNIYPVIKGTTGSDGCVTLDNVPVGEYGVDEIMQAGWSNVSGQVDVNVDGVDDNFTLVNQCTTGCQPTQTAPKICKVNDSQQPLSGWNVFLRGDLLDTVTVPATDEDGVSSVVLANSQTYLFVASGTANAGDGIEFDADYSFRTGSSSTWTDSVSTYEGLGDQLLDLQVNGATVGWDFDNTFDGDHTYAYQFTGTGAVANFMVNDTFPSNNSGNLVVDIYPVYGGVTGEDGCITLDNVAFDSYVLGETMQSGWTNVSGDGSSVELTSNDQTFTLVNTQTAEPCVETNLLDNGGFDAPEILNEFMWDIYTSGSPNLGWVVNWVSALPAVFDGDTKPSVALLELQDGANPAWWTGSLGGGQYAELDTDWEGPTGNTGGEPANVKISQQVDAVTGETYDLSFEHSPRPGVASNITEVYWNGSLIDTISADGSGNSDNVWTTHNHEVVGAAGMDTLEFKETGPEDSLGSFLDSVSLTGCGDVEGDDDDDDDNETPGLDLSIDKSVDDSTLTAGSTATYTITVTNNGSVGATGVTVQDTLPAAVGFISSNTITGSYSNITGIWTIGSLASGATATLTILATVDEGTAVDTLITNTAVVDAIEDETNVANNTDTAEVTVVSSGGGGGGGSSSSRSGGSSKDNDDDEGQVLGDFTGLPYVAPAVESPKGGTGEILGASTQGTLPVTGQNALTLTALLVGIALAALGFRRKFASR